LTSRKFGLRRGHIRNFVADNGDVSVESLRAKYLRQITQEKTPSVANMLLVALRGIFAFGLEHDLCNGNPAREVRFVPFVTDGYPSWTDHQIAQYEDFYPIDTNTTLAL
jgi:hypothetical protein